MRSRQHLLFVTTVLTAGLWLAGAAAQNVIKNDSTNPPSGLKPQSGQINPGVGMQAPAGSPPGKNDQSGDGSKVSDRAPDVRDTAATSEPIPSVQEARAAFQQPLFKDPLAGDGPAPSAPQPKSSDKQKVTGQGSMDPTGVSAGHAAVGGALSPGASAASGSDGSGPGTSGSGGQSPASGDAQPNTQAAAPPQARPRGNGGDEPRLGPIGAIGESMPAKFSKRNDTMDRLPTMAWPIAISDADRSKVFQAAMSDQGKEAGADFSGIKVADQLPLKLALDDMHPLPQEIAAIGDLGTYYYVKGKDKVLLVTPATRTVVDIISAN